MLHTRGINVSINIFTRQRSILKLSLSIRILKAEKIKNGNTPSFPQSCTYEIFCHYFTTFTKLRIFTEWLISNKCNFALVTKGKEEGRYRNKSRTINFPARALATTYNGWSLTKKRKKQAHKIQTWLKTLKRKQMQNIENFWLLLGEWLKITDIFRSGWP